MTIQPGDGKAVAAGYAAQGKNNTQVALARYTADGNLDTSLSSSGIVTTTIGNGAVVSAIAVDSNNKLLAAGSTTQAGQQQFLLIRYNADGSRDTSFGSGGIVTLAIGQSAKAYSLAVQSDGKIVVGGFSSNGINGEHCTLVRFNNDGSLDSANFGSSGIVITTIGTQSHINSLVIQSNGAIVVGGFSDTNYIIARYLSNGTLDTTFNATGIINNTLGLQSQINGIAIDASNNIVAAGFTDSQLLLTRYTSTGSLDMTFNSMGIVTFTLGTINRAQAVTLQTDGKIIAAGFFDNDYLVMRYNANGSIDPSWTINGIVDSGTPTNGVGPTGPPGPTGVSASNADYIFAFDITSQTGIAANIPQTVRFSTIAIQNGWTFATGIFTCPNTGIYQLNYASTIQRAGGASGTPITLRLMAGITGATEIFGSLQTNDLSNSNTRQTMGRSVLAMLNKNDKIILQMIPGNTNVLLVPGSNGTANVSASLNIVRIS